MAITVQHGQSESFDALEMLAAPVKFDVSYRARWTRMLARSRWYAVAFNNDIGKDPKPYGISVFDEPLVLYRDAGGALQCVSDLCPHRAAKLSEGMVSTGLP